MPYNLFGTIEDATLTLEASKTYTFSFATGYGEATDPTVTITK
jgi:uncharacterized protein YjdB